MGRNLERNIVDKVANYIESASDNKMEVLSKRLGLWRFKELKDKLPSPYFLQPDIDILYSPRTVIRGKRKLIGAEVKTVYIRKGNELNVRFYEGLDEAVALLRFGLDGVLFLQVFLISLQNEIERQKIPELWIEYPIPMREIIRNLSLPISYTPALDFLVGNELVPEPIQVLDLRNPHEFPEDKQIIIRYRGENPFLNSRLEYPKIIRNFIVSKFLR